MIKKYFEGQKMGNLTLIKRLPSSRHAKGIFKCDCGNLKEISIHNVFRGATTNCGCSPKHRGAKITHGLSRSRFYHIWSSMYGRCYRPYIGNAYPMYGGRGIGIHFKWHKFQGFIDDMYESYQKHVEEFGEKETSIDRIDGENGYFPDNVRWATNKEQANNIKSNISRINIIDLDGNNISLIEFCKKNNFKLSIVRSLIKDGLNSKQIFESINRITPKNLLIERIKIITNNVDKFNCLDQKKKEILTHRLGLFGEKYHTLEETGKIFSLTRERIRQIENRSIEIILGIKTKPKKIVKKPLVVKELRFVAQKESIDWLNSKHHQYKNWSLFIQELKKRYDKVAS